MEVGVWRSQNLDQTAVTKAESAQDQSVERDCTQNIQAPAYLEAVSTAGQDRWRCKDKFLLENLLSLC